MFVATRQRRGSSFRGPRRGPQVQGGLPVLAYSCSAPCAGPGGAWGAVGALGGNAVGIAAPAGGVSGAGAGRIMPDSLWSSSSHIFTRPQCPAAAGASSQRPARSQGHNYSRRRCPPTTQGQHRTLTIPGWLPGGQQCLRLLDTGVGQPDHLNTQGGLLLGLPITMGPRKQVQQPCKPGQRPWSAAVGRQRCPSQILERAESGVC